jgi:dihydroxyacid dehydratase/phosphogluconate dehydratase
VEEDLRPSQIMNREAFENAIRANAAIGGSTNAIIHLLAIAGRLRVPLTLDDFDELARPVPTLVNLMPSGRYLMEDFCYAGGLPVVLRQLADAGLMHDGQITVTGHGIGTNVAGAECWNADVIRPLDSPLQPPGSGTAVLRGNLCPAGAVIKQSAASAELLTHRGRAVVFDSPEDYHRVAADLDLDVEAKDIVVIRGAGPRGYPGMPEVANVPLPARLLRQGITDMVRICDGRMSGTGYGTVVLHVSPESAQGGPIALVRTGDVIHLDVPDRTLTLEVEDAELERRRASWSPPPMPESGYQWLYAHHVLQADQGADFDFLRGCRGHAVPRDSH